MLGTGKLAQPSVSEGSCPYLELQIAKQCNGGEHSFLLYYVTNRIFVVQDLVYNVC